MAFVLAAVALGRCNARPASEETRATSVSASDSPPEAAPSSPTIAPSSSPAIEPSPSPSSPTIAPSPSLSPAAALEAQLGDLRTQVRVLEHQRLEAHERGDGTTEARLDAEIARLRAEHEHLAHPPEGI